MDMNISGNYVNDLRAAYSSPKARSGSSTSRSEYFKGWETKYKNLKFAVGESAFGKKGVGTVTITKDQLREIENNTEARMKFESMLADCDEVAAEMKNRGGSRMISQGFFYNNDKELQGWVVAKNYSNVNDKYITTLNKETSTGWFNAMTVYMSLKDPYASDWSQRFGR
ncbi:hypothetical protein LJC56_03905 [Christensenellaceae bacterium OttesenSCG-928-K19]|nr:hypothetical protein [Christensenellaceae bacterium OttesenSCG-928-K19]